jgi:DNA-binding SARP family transcriptional activator
MWVEAGGGPPTLAGGVRLALIGGFELRDGRRPVRLPLSVQRLIAFLALRSRPLSRVHVAGALWMDSAEERANASLRSALWRLQRSGTTIVAASRTHVRIDPDVEVDVHEATDRARRLLDDEGAERADDLQRLRAFGEILPDWYEDWIVIERERFRQLRLHALERLCERMTERGRYGQAVEAGLAAVADDPLRESPHRAVIRAHIAEGNPVEARRQYELFRKLLAAQLGMQPSASMSRLVDGTGGSGLRGQGRS